MRLRGGRYPLSVEAPVMAMVDTLVAGVSTLTRLVRYYGLYWALAAFAGDRDLDGTAWGLWCGARRSGWPCRSAMTSCGRRTVSIG